MSYNPIGYSDPIGHRPDDGCRYEGCNLTQRKINENAQKLAILQAQKYQQQCDNGNANYCSSAWEVLHEAIGIQFGGTFMAGIYAETFLQAEVDVVLNFKSGELSLITAMMGMAAECRAW